MKKPTFRILDLLVLMLIAALSTISFTLAYPASIPAHGYFIIEGIPIMFWPAYSILLIINYYFIVSRKVHKVIKILSYYLLSLFALIRMFITPYVSGVFGSDSPTYIGLVDYWISNDIINLQKTAYGDDPGLFIVAKVFNCVTELNTKYLTFILALLWTFFIFMAFRLFVLKHQGKRNTVSYDTEVITLWMSLSYFLLTVFFIVNFQFAPQSFALTLLILSFSFTYNKSDITTPDIILVTILFFALLVSHPFMYVFLIISIGLMYFILKIKGIFPRIFSKLIQKDFNKTFVGKTLVIMMVFIISSIIYILYLTYILKVKLSDAILRAFKHPLYTTALEHYRVITTPSFPEYHLLYLAITYALYIGLVILTIYITFFALIGLKRRTCKLYELTIILASLIWLPPSLIVMGGLSLRGLQVLLLGLLLLAMHGIFVKKNNTIMLKMINLMLIVLAILSNVKYTWYVQPPCLSDSDVLFADVFNMLSIDQGQKILSHVGFSGYYNGKFTGNPLARFINPYLALKLGCDVNKIWILRSNRLIIESNKYGYLIPNYLRLIRDRSIVFSTDIVSLFILS